MTPAVSAAIAAALVPLALYGISKLANVIAWCIRRWMPEGRIKEALLKDD